ncbi:MAG: prepilin-type N-terminal cleavage/methylation domain-containing protein [Candidatus Omnitrophica bacterium]|nr:prepilin-type N-terminal cleavage/methylation domain-containing protein [Candidatus Omnitrophota bacterium]
MKKKRSNSGFAAFQYGRAFTLIEMLIVIVMLSVVSLAVFATFNNGINVWRKVTVEPASEGINIFFERFSSDLRNTFKFKSISFVGREQVLEFPALVYSPWAQAKSIGKIAYEFDAAKGALTKRQYTYSDIYSQAGSVAENVVLKDLSSAKFRYYFYDSAKREYLWSNEWPASDFPLAVAIELEFNRANGNNAFVRTVSIPVGG